VVGWISVYSRAA